jgi:hypothetical protein
VWGEVRYFARGHNDDSGPMLGTKAKSLITSLPVCTGNEEYGSVGGSIVWIVQPGLQLAETGFYRGNMTSYGLLSPDDPHYFWGRRYADSQVDDVDYSDISDGLEIYPVVDDWINFSIYGNVDPSDHNWHIRIEKPGSYTISINDLTLTYSAGSYSQVIMEMHNDESGAVYANFTNIQSAKNVSSTLTWLNWTNSHDIDDSPYLSHEGTTDSEYCMDTTTYGGC